MLTHHSLGSFGLWVFPITVSPGWIQFYFRESHLRKRLVILWRQQVLKAAPSLRTANLLKFFGKFFLIASLAALKGTEAAILHAVSWE